MDKRTFLKNTSLLGIDILASIFALALCLFYCPNLLGQTQKQTFESIAQKVSGKTWVIQKMCEDDSCYSYNYDGYFTFYERYGKRGDTVSVAYRDEYLYKGYAPDSDSLVWLWGYRTCSPVFVCYQADQTKYSHNISLVSNETRHVAFTMLTDSLFVITEHFGKDSCRNHPFDYKVYYKRVKRPDYSYEE